MTAEDMEDLLYEEAAIAASELGLEAVSWDWETFVEDYIERGMDKYYSERGYDQQRSN